MYSGELEVQAKRKAIAVLQDEINRILNAARELARLPDLMMKKDKKGIKNALVSNPQNHSLVKILQQLLDRPSCKFYLNELDLDSFQLK